MSAGCDACSVLTRYGDAGETDMMNSARGTLITTTLQFTALNRDSALIQIEVDPGTQK